MISVSDRNNKNYYIFTKQQLLKYYQSYLSNSNDRPAFDMKPSIVNFFQQIGELQNETLNS